MASHPPGCSTLGIICQYLTNLLDSIVSPGILTQPCKMRWNFEKTFDQVKNKFGEKEVWASSSMAKSLQAQLICLSMNLLQFMEAELAQKRHCQ